MSDISCSYHATIRRTTLASSAANRPAGAVRLLAVSKKQSANKIRTLHSLGQTAFGESYLQEALVKMAELSDLAIEWHFIGPIQSNKSAKIAANFDWAQSVDSARLLQRLSAQRPTELAPLNILLQINIDNEIQKRGISVADLIPLSILATELPGLRLRGLMAIPDPGLPPQAQTRSLEKMAGLFRHLQTEFRNIDTLSLGMSADMEAAITSGSTMVRVGTALFGPRD
ncbi:MAG: YggS family pyridoxal phosphate-dependent enzyme [Xanthomonadales bacterium]|nr:YggS family pyridoxal phosphate-dependent enzyme [Xanthomonadales bacterium]